MLPILLALAFVAVLFLVVVTGLPDEFVVARAARICAVAGKVFPHVNQLRNWEAWNPWGKPDPNCRITYDGPPAGVGAGYAWRGNNKVGEGRSTITESKPNESVRFRLDFLKPMASTSIAEFRFQPDGDQTVVTWTMSGTNNLLGKVFG